MSLLRRPDLRGRLTSVIELSERIKNATISEKVKGGFLGKWGKYWKNVYLDYRDVLVDTTKGCKERPIRASIYALLLGSGLYLSRHNPDEVCYREELLRNEMRLMFVSDSERNPISTNHVLYVEDCLNRNIVRRMNLGILSLIWLDNFSDKCAHYKATCSYLKPRYVNFHRRIIDIGFLDKWWILESRMENYDVNDGEFHIKDE